MKKDSLKKIKLEINHHEQERVVGKSNKCVQCDNCYKWRILRSSPFLSFFPSKWFAGSIKIDIIIRAIFLYKQKIMIMIIFFLIHFLTLVTKIMLIVMKLMTQGLNMSTIRVILMTIILKKNWWWRGGYGWWWEWQWQW